MYPTEQEKGIIEAAEKIMINTMSRYDPSHDVYHVQRVRKTALEIARTLPTQPDLLVVELASLLHDVLDKKYVSAEDAIDPYNFFLPFFDSLESLHGINLVNDGRANLVTQITQNVSWQTEKKLKEGGLWTEWHENCSELHCVQDADRLDAIGAFGVMRCAAYSAITNNPLHAPMGDPLRTKSAMQHFQDKLIHIKERLKTDLGKRLGAKRHQLLLDFMISVEEEYNPSNDS